MYSKAKAVRIVTLSALFIAGLTACVKQRPEIQGQAGREFNPITQQAPGLNKNWTFDANTGFYLKKTEYTIQTAPKALIPAQNSVAEELYTEPDSGLKFLDVMNFKSDHPLLEGKAEIAYMLGEPNRTYPVAQELTPTHLILYKIVTKDELGSNEETFAIQQGNDFFVPVGGYEVSYFKRKRVLNEDNRETNVLEDFPIPAAEYRSATSYRVDKNNFIPFDRFVKSDVLPKSFFDGEWYFSETTVDTSYASGGVVGDLGASDSNFSSATKIRFRIYDDKLVGENTNVDEEFKDDPNSLNYAIVFKIDVEHRDFRWVRTGPDALKEVEEETKDRESKKYIKLDYLKSATPMVTWMDRINSIFGSINNFRNIKDVTYGKDYFSFSVRDSQSESIKRYSMRKITQSQMKPRQAFKNDNRVFGAFTTVKAKKLDYKINLQDDVDKLILMARHNPNKDIVYHFTTGTPKDKWHRDIARESINLWQQAFKKAGLAINIRLDESKDVLLGDIRYNVINIVKRAGSGLLGFGPSLIDSDTGEIVSASMNSGTDGFIEQYFGLIRDYIGRESGYYYNFKTDATMALPGSTNSALLNVISKINKSYFTMNSRTSRYSLVSLSDVDAVQPFYEKTEGDIVADTIEERQSSKINYSDFTKEEQAVLKAFDIKDGESIHSPKGAFVNNDAENSVIGKIRILSAMSFTPTGRLFKYENERTSEQYLRAQLLQSFTTGAYADYGPNFTSTMVMDNAIAKNCPEVTALAERLKSNPMSVSTLEEIQIIRPCVDLFSQIDAVSTVVHEIGHNLSLRHNFKGSVDQKNYPVLNDYTLKYIKVPKEVAIPMSSSIMEYASIEGQQVMPGEYDIAAIRWIYKGEVEKADGSIVKVDTSKEIAKSLSLNELKPYMFCTDEHRILVTDVMCDMHDKGLTPKEAVRFSIESVYSALPRIYRYDRYTVSSRPYNRMFDEALSLKTKYDQWRGFLRKYTGLNKGYLQGYDIQSYAKLIEEIRKKEPEALKEHLEVRNMIVKFLVDIAFISNKYCIVEDSNKIESLYELEKVRKELFGYGNYALIDSCSSAAAADFFKEKQLVVKGEFGHFLDSGRFDQDPAKILEPNDFGGTASVRLFAMLFLNWRLSPSINNFIDGFNPNMLDEPDIRNYIQFLILDRLVNGVRIAHDNSKSEYAVPKSDLFGSAEIKKVQQQRAYVNFENEAELMQAFTGLMADNLWIPGSPDDGRRGYVNVSVGPTNQREGILKEAADFIEYIDVILYVQSRDSFAGQVMGRFKFLRNQKSRMQIKPDDIAKTKLSVMTELTKAGVLFQPLKNHTVLDLLNFYFAANSMLEKLFSDSNTIATGYSLMNIAQPEFSLFEGFMQNLQAQGLTLEQLMSMYESKDANEKAMADKILLAPIGPIYEQYKQQDPTLAQPTLLEMNKRFDAFLKMHTEEYNNFTRSALEYDSQIDLLQRIIQILSR